MAWVDAGFNTGGSSKTSGTALSSGSLTVAVGDVLVVVIAADNVGTVDGDNSEVSSVTDTLGNTYTKAAEFTNAKGSAGSGATCSVWYSKIAAAGNAAVSVTFATAITAKALSVWRFSVAAGATVSVAASATLANDNADPGSMSISGLASQEYLFIRGIASETNSTVSLTATSGYTAFTGLQTSGAAAASNMAVRGEFDIATGTGSTSDPTFAAAYSASVFVALQESAGGSYSYTAAGGGQSGGVAAPVLSVAPKASGGALASGIAALALGAVVLASGGATSGGAATVSMDRTYVYAAAGGAQSGGSAAFIAGRSVQASGGAQAGGVAALVPGWVFQASGGAQSGGVAGVLFPATYVYVAAGGAQSGGSALALSGFTGQLLTVRLHDAAGAPQVGAVVLAWRVRVGGAKYTVIDPTLSRAVTDGDGVAVLTLMPSLGDAYRVTATAGDGTPLLDVSVLVGPGDGELHSLPRMEDMQAWH